MTSYIGKPTSRVDGRAKVTGAAKYAGEYNSPELVHGYIISGAISKGRIKSIDASAALAIEGVLQVFTHENRPRLAWMDRSYQDEVAPNGSPFRPLYDEKIRFSQQPVALVVADSFDLARYAATLVKIEYEEEEHDTDMEAGRDRAYPPKAGKQGYKPPAKPRGDAEKAFAGAQVQVEANYSSPFEHHNPMEPHATTVMFEPDGKLTIYDKTQGVLNSQKYICQIFGLKTEQVRVLAPYVGGAFGSGLRPQHQIFMAVLAATELKRSVRVTLTRQQMFSIGYRPETHQHIAIGAREDGHLEAFMQEALANTSRFEDFTETVVNWAGALYTCENSRYSHELVQLDLFTPIDMRAPGGALALYAIESAMDEVAVKAGIDPLQLRLINYTEKDQEEDKPFSSKELRQCYLQAAEKFGWEKRSPEPRSMRDGDTLIGWGMATGIWDSMQSPAASKAVLGLDGHLLVTCAITDIGPGTYTIMTQIAADTLGLPIEKVTFQLGDSNLPQSSVQGGSQTAGSVGTAVKEVCQTVAQQLFKLAQQMPNSPFAKVKFEDVKFADGHIQLVEGDASTISLIEVLRSSGNNSLEAMVNSKPDARKQSGFAQYVHSAVFVEVRVDDALGTIRVSRVVNAVAAGKILNPKTARSQVLGGVVWGVGMALEEESLLDNNLGRFMNHNLSEYHVPVNADIGEIDVIFVQEEDTIVNPLGVKGVGEIGIVGTAAAIANAVYHATGKRIRDLPITLDKLL
jgi:xanthine dehydrogenase YagR molybdenum-binding subunit